MPTKILIVEDNRDMRDVLHYYLTDEGFTVVSAGDGREGLYLTKAEHPDLIITDIAMPVLDGIALIKEVRVLPECKNLPILVFTSSGQEERNNAIRAGATRAVDKGTLFESLTEITQQLKSAARRGVGLEQTVEITRA